MDKKISIKKISKEKLNNINHIPEKINNILGKYYPNATSGLIYKNSFELLCAVILSAQCTDKQVNKVTPLLFKKFPNPLLLSQGKIIDIEKIIKSTGFYHNKAKHLSNMGKELVEKHNSKIPETLLELIKLAGVGRKTANVVLAESFNVPTITVDTHVGRLSRRIGFTKNINPEKVEKDLMVVFPKTQWINISRRLIFHGRKICFARNPQCSKCPIYKYCKKIFNDK